MTDSRITLAHGDGIGPEIMRATLEVLEAAEARLTYDTIEIGQAVYLQGESAGIRDSAWETLRKNKVFLKAPITTPQGGGFKSLNVTVRKSLGLYANVRPCRSYAPYVPTKHQPFDLLLVRENEEDVYGGIEYRQTGEVYQCLKLISRPGCERIIRYAFESARQMGRKKVSCFSKDNIMKMTDGLFHRVFDEIGEEYPELQKEHWIVDIGAARLADTPEIFDVIVLPNLYGDILSDVAAQIGGSVGLGGSANIGEECAMFEAIHGSAPLIAGKGIANPSGLILGAVMMLVHLGQGDVAEKIHNGWLTTLEDGVRTGDMTGGPESGNKSVVGTEGFTRALIERLGEEPKSLQPVRYGNTPPLQLHYTRSRYAFTGKKELVGFDIFFESSAAGGDALATTLQNLLAPFPVLLQMITNRGVKVWPGGQPETFCVDHWRCRLVSRESSVGHYAPVAKSLLSELLGCLEKSSLEVIKIENLYTFDGEPGFSLGQGQ